MAAKPVGEITVPTAEPPLETISVPKLSTRVPIASPPLCTASTSPDVTSTPLTVWPASTSNMVVATKPLTFSNVAPARQMQRPR